MRWALLLLVSTGCNRALGLDPTTELDAYVVPDAVGCSGVRFVGTTTISIVGDEPVFDPTQSDDALELWFTWQLTNGDYHVAHTTRSDVAGGFAMPTIEAFGLSSHDTDPAVTNDGLHLLFLSSDSRVYQVDRPTRGSTWSPATIVAGIDGQDATYGIDISRDGLTIYIADGGGGLHTASRPDATAAFGMITDLAVGRNVMFPSISPDQRELFFNPAGIQELHRITRNDPSLDFDITTDEMLLEAGADPDISPDSRTLVYQVNGDLKATHRDCSQ